MTVAFFRFFAPFQRAILAASIVCFALALPVPSSSQEAAPKPPPLRARALGSRPDLDSLPHATVPFAYNPPTQPYITVQARINGSLPLTFLVDTGSGVPVLVRPWAAKVLGLKTSGQTATLNPGNIRLDLVPNCAVQLVTQPATPEVNYNIENVAVADTPFFQNFSSQLAGMIGGAWFSHQAARIDFDTKTLTFFNGSHTTYKPEGMSVALPLRNQTVNGSRPYTRFTLPGMQNSDFLLDTGATTSSIPAEQAKDLPQLAVTTTLSTNLAQSSITHTVLLPSLKVGVLQIPLVRVELAPAGSDVALGMDFLSRFRLTLDPDNAQLTLEPRLRLKRRLVGQLGLDVKADKGALSVVYVSPEAAQAGVALGDVLKSIDGTSTKELTGEEALAKLTHYVGEKVTVEVEKPDHHIVTAQWSTRGYDVVAGPFGLTLLKSKDKPALVLDVEDGSEAEKAGIVLEDELLSINGKKTTALMPQTLEAELESAPSAQGSLLLTFRRKKDKTEYTLKGEGGKLLSPKDK